MIDLYKIFQFKNNHLFPVVKGRKGFFHPGCVRSTREAQPKEKAVSNSHIMAHGISHLGLYLIKEAFHNWRPIKPGTVDPVFIRLRQNTLQLVGAKRRSRLRGCRDDRPSLKAPSRLKMAGRTRRLVLSKF